MIEMLEVRHLRLVRAIAEEGGPTRAAARLHLTQSAVSHQLTELEGRLGVALFARTRRRLVLTPAGTRLLEAARDLLSQLARVERELYRAGAKKRVVVRVCVETFTSYHWLPAVVCALEAEHLEVELRIELEATAEPVAALLRGELDLALVASPVQDRQLVTTPLFDDEWTVICAPGHALAARPYISALELGGQRLLTHDPPRGDVERLRTLLAAEHARMPEVERVPLTDALVELVKAGRGVALVSRWAVAPYEARGELALRRFTRAGMPEHWRAVYRADAAQLLPLARIAALIPRPAHAALPKRVRAAARRH